MNNNENNTKNGENLNVISLGSMPNINNEPQNSFSVDNGPSIPSIEPMDTLDSEVVPEAVPSTIQSSDVNSSEALSQPSAPVEQNTVQPIQQNVVQSVEPLTSDTNNQVPLNDINTQNQVIENPAPVAPLNYDIPETINSFSSSPIFNDIGTVPPINDAPVTTDVVSPPPADEPKPDAKKGMNKVLFVLIVVLALAAVGVGVYVF